MRNNGLVPTPERYQLALNAFGVRELSKVARSNGISDALWCKPTIHFLWRYRQGSGAVSGFGQKTQERLVCAYSALFQRLIAEFDCCLLIGGMNIVTTDSNREITDNKYPAFGLDIPADHAIYMKGLSWPLELEIASRATVCTGHASGFTEGLWLKRGRDMVLFDAPSHYLAKIAYHRMPFFSLNRPLRFTSAFLSRSADAYCRRIEFLLNKSAKTR
jgi:hypothetical protein